MISLLSLFIFFILSKQSPPDLCSDAKVSAATATDFSKDSNYIKAIARLRLAASDGKEHSISFGKDSLGNIITSELFTGNQHSSKVPGIKNRFADMHNHQDNSPPFSGDVYGFIDFAISSSLYHTRYIVTQNGTVYALTMVDMQAAKDFNTSYPRILNPGYQPRFPDALVDEYRLIKYGHGASEEMAVAFILEKYKTGVALLKQDSIGNFKRLNTTEVTDANGNKMYIATNCK